MGIPPYEMNSTHRGQAGDQRCLAAAAFFRDQLQVDDPTRVGTQLIPALEAHADVVLAITSLKMLASMATQSIQMPLTSSSR